MRIQRTIYAVDSHTMGEPTRVVVGGLPRIPGNSMAEKKAYLEKNQDHLRKALMHEPRGHNDMFGSILTDTTHPEADLGIIFMDGGGYLNMCGHGTIGAVTVAIETGIVKAVEPETRVVLETPAGLVKARAQVKDNVVKQVSFENVPAFLFESEVEFDLPGVGALKADIAFGGSFFAIVSARDLGIEVVPKNASQLVQLGLKIREILNKKVKVQHPEKQHINRIDLVEIYDRPSHPEADLKNVVIFGNGQVDRSPCGTGTCAKMATLFSKGELQLNETFIYESILGTLFEGKLLRETKVGGFDAVVPEITGNAFITGFNQLVIDPEDPLKHGFVLK